MPSSATPLSDRDRVFYFTEWFSPWRAAAILFALGATVLAVVCFIFVLYPPLTVVFLPGYLITVGYHWRVWGNPSRKWTRAIWTFSLVVQGIWLLVAVVGIILSRDKWQADPTVLYKTLPFVAWWLITTAVSGFGIMKDGGN